MALFGIETLVFKCENENCDSIHFEEVDVKSYLIEDDILSIAATSKKIKCIKCGAYYDIDENYKLIRE